MNELNFDDKVEMSETNESADTIINQVSKHDGMMNLTIGADFHNEIITGKELETRRYKQLKTKGKQNRLDPEVYVPNNIDTFID